MEIKVKVKANKNKQEIIKVDDKNYIVSLKSPAIKNKANEELIKLFSKELGLIARIKHGLTSNDKVLEVKPKDI